MTVDGAVRVVMRFGHGRAEQRCGGPTAAGNCPRATRGGPVACAGAEIIALRGTAEDGRRVTVAHGAGSRCPLAHLVSRDPAPWD